MSRIRDGRLRVRVGAPDPALTGNAGLVAVAELIDRLGVVETLDSAIGAIKLRDRGFSGGQLLVGLATAQVAGEAFWVGLDRLRSDTAGRRLIGRTAGLASTTAHGLARRLSDEQWLAVETGLARVHERMLAMVPARQRARLESSATVDLDATEVEVYGRAKRGVAYNYAGQRCGRPHVAVWAECETVLAADLLAGDEDPRAGAAGLLARALATLPDQVRGGNVQMRADAGYFAGQLARAAHFESIGFAIGAKRIAPLWRLLAGIAESAWIDAIDMDNAQVAVAEYCPDWWPANTRLLVRRVRLDPSQVSTDPRSRRRRTLHPEQRALPIDELAGARAIYGYSFVLTNLDVSSPVNAAAVEHWYRRRTTIENLFRDTKIGAGLRHLPSGYPEVNTAWTWGALLAASIAGWLHQLTGVPAPDGTLAGHGVRDGKAMIETLRWRLINIPGRLIRHARQIILRLPPGHDGLLAEILARIRALPTHP